MIVADDVNIPALASGVIVHAIVDARWKAKREAVTKNQQYVDDVASRERAIARAFLSQTPSQRCLPPNSRTAS